MDRVTKNMTKNAKEIDDAFRRSNGDIEKAFELSGKSAAIFNRELNKSSRQYRALREQIDPTFAAQKRMEANTTILNQALERGQIDLQTYESTLELVRAEYNLTANAAGRMAAAGGTVARGFAGSRGQIQNVAFQVGDFATQVGAGTSASIALGQQLPQLLGGFGALGAVLGAVVAIGVPLGAALLRSGDEAGEVTDKMDALTAAVNDYVAASRNSLLPTDELVAKFGSATEAARVFADSLREISRVNASEALSASISDLVTKILGSDEQLASQFATFDDIISRYAEVQDQLTGSETDTQILGDLESEAQKLVSLINGVDALAAELDISRASALELANAVNALSAQDGPQATVDAAVRLQDVLVATFGNYEDMNTAARELFDQTVSIGNKAAEMQGAIESTSFSAQDLRDYLGDVVANIGTAVGQADTLASSLAAAAQNAFAAAQNMVLARAARAAQGPDAAVQETRDTFLPNGIRRSDVVSSVTLPARPAPTATRGGGGGRSSGGGGRSGGAGRDEVDIFANAEQQITNLQRQISLLGKSKAEVAGLRTEYELLDAAKKAGIDLDARSAATGQTVRERIAQQAQSVRELTVEMENYAARVEFADSLQDRLTSGLVDAIVAGDGLADTFRNLALSIAKANIEAALFGTGPFGGSTGGGLLGPALGELFDGFRADGGPVRAGGTYVVGERGPELFTPNTAGRIIPNGAGAGGTVRIMIEESGQFAARVRTEAQGVAVEVVSAYDQQMPSRVRGVMADPRRR